MINRINIGAILMLLHVITGCILNYNYRILTDTFPREYIQVIINISTIFFLIPLYYSINNFKTKIFHLHFIRALCYIISQIVLSFIYNRIPFIQITAITLTYPIFGTIAGIIFLKEKIKKRTVFALIIGLLGTIIIIKPFSCSFQKESLLTFIAIFSWIVFDIITKKINHQKESCKLQFFYIMICYFMMSIFIYFFQDFSNISYGIRDVSILIALGSIVILYLYTALSAIIYSPSISSAVSIYMFSFVLGAIIGHYFFDEALTQNVKYGIIMVLISNIMCIVKNKNNLYKK